MTSLQEAGTDELMQELRRRSVGCLVVVFKVDENTTEEWFVTVKGSPPLVQTMAAALQSAVNEAMEDNGKPRKKPSKKRKK